MPEMIFRKDGAVLVHNDKHPSFVLYNVHSADQCAAEGGHCVIHNPSDHRMRDFDLLMRSSGLMERICSHGVGHPDPDSLAFFDRVNPGMRFDVHGCCGCCLSDDEWHALWNSIPENYPAGPPQVGESGLVIPTEGE